MCLWETLRAALAFPSPESLFIFNDEQLEFALQALGLDRLSFSLDLTTRWDRELSDDEQRLLVFARILLNQPHWVVIDQAFDAMDEDTRANGSFISSMRTSNMPPRFTSGAPRLKATSSGAYCI
jgi:ABC-type uncharacterized transport system fused permease/ATPase subunit